MADRLTAVVTDNLNYTGTYQPFERAPSFDSTNTLVPRGVRRFWFADDISAKPINDQIDVFITATLPENFAYIITRFNYQLSSDVAGSWANTVVLRMFNHIPGQPLGTAEIVSCSTTTFTPSGTPVAQVRSFDNLMQGFTGPMWATHGGNITFRIQATNVAAPAGAAAFITSHVEFLEYDLTQAQRYYINTPWPVLAR